MNGGNEQRVAIIFCFKAGLSATETLVLAQKAYGNDAVNQPKVFRWYPRFRDGSELVENDEFFFNLPECSNLSEDIQQQY